MNNLPLLLQSESDPIMTGSKALPLQKFDSTHCTSKHQSRSQIPLTDNNPKDLHGTGLISSSDAGGKVNISQSEYFHVDKTSNYMCEPENNTSKSISNKIASCCFLKRVQSCYAVVRRDSKYSLQFEPYQLRSNSALPGVVDHDEIPIDSIHQKQATAADKVGRFWNASLQISYAKQNVDFKEYCHHFLFQMRKFIIKLQQSIKDESMFLQQFDSLKSAFAFSTKECISNPHNCTGIGNDTKAFNFKEKGNAQFHEFSSHPLKLGKVYSELQEQFKVWNVILEDWQARRQEMDSNMLRFFIAIHKRLQSYQTRMLVLSEKLIVTRLLNFSCCVMFHSKKDAEEKEWDYILGPSYLKRLCKLMETYNKLLRQENKMSMPFQDKFNYSFQKLHHSTFTENSLLNSFDVSRILTILASPIKHELASSLLNILTVVQQTSDDSSRFLQQETPGNNLSNHYNFDWSSANDFEIDEDHVITHIAGYEVNNISTSPLSDENKEIILEAFCLTLFSNNRQNGSKQLFLKRVRRKDSLAAIKRLLYGQGSFIVWFLNCLAANTSLLRSNLQSKSPRSVVSSQAFTDDVSVISSDEEASSVASSLIFSPFNSTSTSHRNRKTVLWRDSWDQEVVTSSCKLYMAAIVTEGPVETLLHRVNNPGFEPVNVGTELAVSSLLLSRRNPSCYRPRFWFDLSTLALDATVMNMLTLDILTEDILERLHHSTQAFIVEKALERWDHCFCLALGTGINDKCGSIIMEGYPSITKTAWTYVKAIQALTVITERYSTRIDVIENALPRLQATLDAFYLWCHLKIQQFVAGWQLRELMQVTLGDLKHLTQLALQCLPLVEKCHNYVESKRVEMPGTLQVVTFHLRNIDSIITNMQSLSGHCVKSYTKKCAHLSKMSIKSSFPQAKVWKQKNISDHSRANRYMVDVVANVLAPICDAVSPLKPQSQLTSVPPAVASILNAVIGLILHKNICFSIQGALQLQRDFDYVIDYVCSSEARLCEQVQRAAPNFSSVAQAFWVVNTLQRTDPLVTSRPSNTGYEATRRRGHATRSVSPHGLAGENDDADWTNRENELLALRAHVRRSETGKCLLLPCYDKAVD